LDPAATGLLIICTGAGTKSIEGFMAAHKEYSGTLKLGEGTPSQDAETPVEERLPWEQITGVRVKLGLDRQVLPLGQAACGTMRYALLQQQSQAAAGMPREEVKNRMGG
jgi:hypothetical protein